MSAAEAWDALWLNVHLATMAPERGYGEVRDAALAVRNGRIAWLGPRKELPGRERATVIHDGRSGWLTPGLIDCHTHLVYAGSRADEFERRLAGERYEDIARAGGGIMATVRATREASEDVLLRQSAVRLRRLAGEGVTTVEIKSGYGLTIESELKMLRVARRLGEVCDMCVRTSFLGAHAQPPEYAGRGNDYIEHLCERMLPILHAERLVDAVDAYCERIAFSSEQVERLFARARELDLPVKLHADQLSDCGGAALAARHAALSADHLECSNVDSIRSLAEAGTVAVLLPGAFYFLRETRQPPIQALRQHKVPIAVATDCNPGTSPCTSLLLMLNMGCTLFGLLPAEVLAGVTRNAARALGLQDEVGRLVTGQRADLALWDIRHPAELAYVFGANPCVGRWRAGRAVASGS